MDLLGKRKKAGRINTAPVREEPAANSRRGAALVLALLLLAIITILLSEFVFHMRIQTALYHNHEARVQGRAVADAGLNAAEGLLLHASPENESLFNNPILQLYRWQCQSTPMLPSLGMTEEQETAQQRQATDTAAMQGCGRWSLAIPYQMGETSLDVGIYDEQARINLNAIMREQGRQQRQRGGGQQQQQEQMPSYTEDTVIFNTLLELFRLQVAKNNIELEVTPYQILMYIKDYIDCCMVDGSFDRDQENYFEYEDKIIPMKNGPLETVEEIRLVPGMKDELFNAIKDFLTVYPTAGGRGGFDRRINMNTAPVEVLYAVFRGCSYSGGAESTLPADQAMQMANDMINSNLSTTQNLNVPGGADMRTYNRADPPEMAGNRLYTQLKLNPRNRPRYYRIRSTAYQEDGLQTTIIKVVRFRGNLDTVYYKEL